MSSMYSENSKIFSQKFSTEVTNKAKSAIWLKITDSVNSKGVSLRTVDQVKEKWGNMAQKAKQTYTEYRLQQRKTGGPPPPEVSNTTANIIPSMKDTASFSGVPGGIDTDILNDDLLSGDVLREQTTESSQYAITAASPAASTAACLPASTAACLPASTAAAACSTAPTAACPTAPTSTCSQVSAAKKVKKSKVTQEDVLAMPWKRPKPILKPTDSLYK